MNWLSELPKTITRRASPYRLFADCNENGVSQQQNDLLIHIAWADVISVVAYKKDCWMVDDIRIILSDGVSQIECSESQISLVELDLAMKVHLPLDVADWFERLMRSPAFKATATVVYTRPDLNS